MALFSGSGSAQLILIIMGYKTVVHYYQEDPLSSKVENVVTDFILTEKLLMFTYLAKYIAEF